MNWGCKTWQESAPLSAAGACGGSMVAKPNLAPWLHPGAGPGAGKKVKFFPFCLQKLMQKVGRCRCGFCPLHPLLWLSINFSFSTKFPFGMTPSQEDGVSGCPEGRHLPKRFVQPRPPPAGTSDGGRAEAVGTEPPGCTHFGLCPALGWVVESRNGEGVKLQRVFPSGGAVSAQSPPLCLKPRFSAGS